ncbi:hypothetical protein TWF694_007308 [Orbilia ellipsospora]|uniref:Aminotransferase class I/classII large domain-containing protein n=1 Tax=Orbilia ellipsospora TaxID=2528407 RepID=A0AAV9XI88_9PEZI
MHLDEIFKNLLVKREANNRLRRLTLRDPGTVDFSSNGYLSLSTHPDIKNLYNSRLQSSEDFALGSGGSRLLDGNSVLAEKLEVDIAAFHGAPAGLLFVSGFEANTGLFSCAPQPGDYVVYDELIHASVHDGMRLSRAKTIAFAHNLVSGKNDSIDSKSKSLEGTLSNLLQGENGNKIMSGVKNVFVAVEGVYSMDGDIAPLKEIVECVEKSLPRGNGYIIVDEAHSTGWLGNQGRGLVCQLGLESRIWARVHTFGKAMGCSGAIVLCTPTTRSYLINYARSLIYTTAMGYPMLAAIQTAYEFLESSQAESLFGNLLSLMAEAHALLLSICERYKSSPELFRVNAQPPASPIIPLFSGKARSLARYCQERGYMIRPIVAPTVPKGTDRLRLCLHASNALAEVKGLCAAIEDWLQEQTTKGIPSESGISRSPQPNISFGASSIGQLSKL